MSQPRLYDPRGELIAPSQGETLGGVRFTLPIDFTKMAVFKARPIKLEISGEVPVGANELGLFIKLSFIDGRVYKAGPIVVNLRRPKEPEDAEPLKEEPANDGQDGPH